MQASPSPSIFRSGGIRTVVRLAPGATRADLERELRVLEGRLQAEYGTPDHPVRAYLWDLRTQPPRLDGTFGFLFAVMAGVLAIACANLATLLLARGAVRRRETAVRVAIGATRWTVARQVLLECALVAAGGALVGLVLTHWASRLVAHWAPPFVPQLGEYVPHASWRTFAFVLGVTALVIAAAAFLPSLRAASVPPSEPLKDGAGTTRRRRERWSALVVAEVAMSTALLMVAGMVVMANWRLARHEFGFDARRLVSVRASRLGPSGRDSVDAPRQREAIVEAMRRVPGVRDVATVWQTGPKGPAVIGENGRAGERWMNLRNLKVVSPSYLSTLGIPVVDGRDFAPGDASGSAPVVIVDRDAARRLWPEFASPVGRMIKLGSHESDAAWVRVVGVAEALGRRPDAGPSVADDPDIYVVLPNDTTHSWDRGFVVATERQDPRVPLAIRRALREVVGTRSFIEATPYAAGFDRNVRFSGFLARLFVALGAFALVLCGVGLYGVLAYTVSQREREFAIRIALGARSPAVARLVVRDASVMALAGVGLGAFLALWATWGMATEMADVRFAHARALVAAEAVLLLVALAAAWRPVRAGMRASPASMLQAN